jgi:hypothetical protein
MSRGTASADPAETYFGALDMLRRSADPDRNIPIYLLQEISVVKNALKIFLDYWVGPIDDLV